MAVLGLDQVLKRVKKKRLIENLGERDLNNPEGVGLDLRLGAIHQVIRGGAFIEADGKENLGKRRGVKTKQLAEFKAGVKSQKYIILKPEKYYLIQTIESLNTPNDLMPLVYPRSSLFRAGLLLLVTKIDPGYQGFLTFGLVNLSPFGVRLQMGARICNIVFHQIKGKTVKYRGQHQGGRISPKKAERQV